MSENEMKNIMGGYGTTAMELMVACANAPLGSHCYVPFIGDGRCVHDNDFNLYCYITNKAE